MKIIFSRKGFDSAYGGVPSPILPDGRLLSLPVPIASPIRYGDVSDGDVSIGRIVRDLTGGRLTADDAAHLDPDLRAGAYPREAGWRPVFGQAGQAQAHLANQGVGPGDLFLFFGWFRRAERVDGRYRFVPGAPDLHVLHGWLQVDEAVPVDPALVERHPWVRYHPHIRTPPDRKNHLYIARPKLSLGGRTLGRSGGGAFRRYDDRLRLTAPGETRSVWRLPGWMHPDAGRAPLTYHANPALWSRGGDHAVLRTVGRGQEFVLDASDRSEAEDWARRVLDGA